MKLRILTTYPGEKSPCPHQHEYFISKGRSGAILFESTVGYWTAVPGIFTSEAKATEFAEAHKRDRRSHQCLRLAEAIRTHLYYELPGALNEHEIRALLEALSDFNHPLRQIPRRFSEEVYKFRTQQSKPIREGVIRHEDGTSGTNWWLLPHGVNLNVFLEDHGAVGTGCDHDCSGRYFARDAFVKRSGRRGVLVVQSWGLDV